jgi:site-specific DNA recombinase
LRENFHRCIIQSIRIGKMIYEDHSGNTFRRTEWTKLVSVLRGNKRHADFILFTTWDRFSMHAESAFRMYSMLLELGTQLQAIEQPLNLSVPCNKEMLAFIFPLPGLKISAVNLIILYERKKRADR